MNRRLWTTLWLVLALALVIRTGVRDRGVITDHLEFGRRVLCGEELYARYLDSKPLHAPYPPGFGLLAAPFSVLPERAARFLWGVLQVLGLGAIGLWLREHLTRVAPGQRGRTDLILLLTALLGARYILRDTHGGGGNLINLALALCALGLADRGRALAAGLVLGFSLATKPTHVLIVPLLWVFGHRRASCTAIVAALGFTAVALLGLRQGLAPLERWLQGSLAYGQMPSVYAEPALGFPPFTWMNQCLRCAVSRYLGDVPVAVTTGVPGFFPGLGLGDPVVAWTSRGLAGALLIATAAACVRWRTAVGWLIGAVLALSLLLSPISWKAHHVALLPAFGLLLARGLDGRRRLLALLGTYALLCVAGEEITGRGFKQMQQSLYVVTAGTVALWALCLAEARRDARLRKAPDTVGLGTFPGLPSAPDTLRNP